MAALSFAEFESTARRAESQVATGQWRSAFDLYRRLLQVRVHDLRINADALTDTDLLVFERVADLAVPLGETAAADALYSVACDFHQRSNPRRFVHAAIKRVQIALAADRFSHAMLLVGALEPSLGPLAAIDCTEQGLDVWEATRPWRPESEPALESQIYLVLGRLLAGAGQFNDASTFFRRGLAYTTPDRPPLAQQAGPPLKLAMAAAALGRGAVLEARTILGSLDGWARRPGDAVRLHELGAAASILCGEFDRALAQLGEASAICRQNGFTHALASVLMTRGKLQLLTNQTVEANGDIGEAAGLGANLSSRALVERCSRLAEYARTRQETLFGTASFAEPIALMQGGASADADSVDARAATYEVISWRPSDFLAYYEERELELVSLARDPASAERVGGLLQLVVEDFGRTDSPYILARLQLLRGVCNVQRLAWARALPDCTEAADAFSALDNQSDEYTARRFEALCLERVGTRNEALAAVRARSQRLLETLTAGMSVPSREAYLVNKWSEREAELADAVTRLVAERGRLDQSGGIRRWLGLATWFARVACLHHALVDSDAHAWHPTRVSWRSRLRGWRTIAFQARERQTVSFAALANGLVRVTLRWCHCDVVWLPISRGHLRSIVRRFHEQLAAGGPESDLRAETAAEELGAALCFPDMLRKLPARVRRITVFPDDQLHAFPFAVLPSGETGKRVLDGWAVTIGVRRAQPSVARRRPTRVTIAAANGGTHLQEAPKQVQWLVKWWTERGTVPVALSGDKCDATAFLSALSSSDAVHFSGHGRFDPGDPENTGIVVPGLGNGEEVISLARLAATDCSRLRFATFLSCWSADSFLFPGQWSVSIPSALCRAGAACVIAPLWEIEDSISTQLLLAVYQGLGDRRVRRVDEAVRQAQLDARALPDGRMQSLFFWAGLQVFGDGGPISFSRGIRWRRSTA